ncbi:hypothetical protein MSC49_22240 [Methylosinus sp. C49]|uniref:hypothetical protein n=1 Tax=Methylosinus sp. C49 TaxID=2699395 RepID=UPI0013676CAB|nr:hypothetical protein [Methylosinus sp. C49]BBU62289.1 hypothetical protein MSC49_22240 [Methylosinus sp. C49]
MRKSFALALPALLIAGSASAAVGDQPADTQNLPGASAPAQAAAPSPCAGCAGHDCANCLMAAAAQANETAQPTAPIRCSVD